jgi:hypothetical protein
MRQLFPPGDVRCLEITDTPGWLFHLSGELIEARKLTFSLSLGKMSARTGNIEELHDAASSMVLCSYVPPGTDSVKIVSVQW